MWTFFKQHQFLPDVRILIIKYYFIPTLDLMNNFVCKHTKIKSM